MIPILLNPAFSNTRIEGRLYSNTKSKHSDYRSMRKIITDGFFQCVSNNTLPPIWFTDKIAYFSIEALHITFGHEADIAYSFPIHFNTKIMNTFFLADNFQYSLCIF